MSQNKDLFLPTAKLVLSVLLHTELMFGVSLTDGFGAFLSFTLPLPFPFTLKISVTARKIG